MKMRITIFFMLIFIKHNVCEESNESKYIDLLPEEEKEQFLQKIARRIFEEAEVSDDRYKHSREVTDDQLNEHTDFVEKILREESANLRKQNRDEREREHKSEESMRVKPLLKDKISGERDDSENRYVDLTLRQGSRKKRRDNLNVDVEHGKERNKVVGNNSSNLADVQRYGTTEEFVNKEDQSSFEDIQVKYFNKKHEANDKNSDEATSTSNKPQITPTTNFDNESVKKKFEEITTVIPTSENIEDSQDNMSKKVESLSQHFTESINEVDDNNDVTEKATIATTIKTSTTEEPLTIVSTDTQQVNDTKRVLRSDLHEIATVSIISDGTYVSKETMQDTNSHKNMYHRQNTQEHKNSIIFKDTDANTNYSYEIRDQLKETTISNQSDQVTTYLDDNIDRSTNILDLNTTIITNETTTNYDEKVNILHKKNNGTNHEATEIDNSNVTKDRSVMIAAGDVVKVLRQRLVGDSKKFNSTELKTKLDKYDEEDPLKKLKQSYNVYELPTNQEPFSMKRIIGNYKNQEQPQYVPIYDYSPNNAYFNAQNRYGPNLYDNLEERYSDIDFHGTDRQDDIYLSKENLGALRERNRKFRFGNKGSPKRTHKLSQTMIPVVNKTPPFLEDIINPDDYLDTDYYYGRTNTHFKDQRQDNNKKLPDSYEETHPSLDKIKDHIRSVRKILFQNQIFGYIPPVNGSVDVTPPQKVLKVTQTPPYKYLKRKSDKNMPQNYYSGRMKTIDDEYENVGKDTKVGYVKYNNFIQDLYVTKDVSEKLLKKVNVIKFAGQLFFRVHTISNMTNVASLRNKTKIFSLNESPEYYDTINKVLKLTNEVDLFTTLEKMRDIKIPYTRSGYVFQDLSLYLKVLDDIQTTDNKSFIQYDWLSTTVDIQSALRRLIDMTEAVQNKIVIHPADLGLLKYVIYLFQTAKTKLYLELELGETNLSRMMVILPRNRKRKKMFLKEKGLLNRVWLFKRENMIESGVLTEFNTFLYELQTALFDLHNAIKHIALVTKYTNQAWFKHLRRIYLTNDKKHLLEVALHLTATRLFGLIEESAINGVEMNIANFVRNNEKQVERSIDECVFLLRLLNEIKQLESYLCIILKVETV